LYITSLGLYEASLNDQRVGTDIFTPGWTDYDQRLQYQTYDVTDMLTDGLNTISAVLGDGWYCGYVAWEGRQQYGDRPKLLAQLEITLANGSTQTITTDGTWGTTVGPLLEADLIMGEAYDARLAINNWSSAQTFSHPPSLVLAAQNTPTVRTHEELTPISEPIMVWSWPQHNWIFDFGQNLVGRVRLKVKGARGTTISLRFGEMLDENSRLYTENLRTARQTDYYTMRGEVLQSPGQPTPA
jgi:alpha-L-rhamnosidase